MNTNHQYRPGLPPLPAYMRDLALSDRGYPVPYFVTVRDGTPDFQLADSAKWVRCVEQGRCWICGKPLGAFKVFAIGPMAGINRISAEPPSHLDCAEYAVAACPFLLYPKAKRRAIDDAVPNMPAPGVAEEHNPGMTLLWATKSYHTDTPTRPSVLRLGEPTTVRWFSEGRPASRELAIAAADDAYRRLSDMCGSQRELDHLDSALERLLKLLPRELCA